MHFERQTIWLPNQVWATDITYIKLEHGSVYLVMIIDLYLRKILSWRISNTRIDLRSSQGCRRYKAEDNSIVEILFRKLGQAFQSPSINRSIDDVKLEIFMHGAKALNIAAWHM